MYPAEIDDYQRPSTLSEALTAISNNEDGDTMLIAGGQSLMQAIKSRMIRPSCLIDLQNLTELRGIDQSKGLRIGAMTRYVELAQCKTLPPAYAALVDAASHVGDRQVRNRGTIGGSVCWNYVTSCMPTVVLGLGATMSLVSPEGGSRDVAAEDFIIAPFETSREENEILVSLSWPRAPTSSGSAYKKCGLVTDALPVIGVCVSVSLGADGNCTDARVAIAGLLDGGQIVAAGGAALVGSDGNPDAIEKAMNAVVDTVEVHSDKWADTAYRQQLIRTLGAEVTTTAFSRAQE
jgi:carbon-monoxide dehydrogenase medium subunit